MLVTTLHDTISTNGVCDPRGWVPHGLALSPLKPQRREGHLGCIKARRVAVGFQVTDRRQQFIHVLFSSDPQPLRLPQQNHLIRNGPAITLKVKYNVDNHSLFIIKSGFSEVDFIHNYFHSFLFIV